MNNFKNKNRFLQYELWKDCCIGCSFCLNKGQPDIDKIDSLNFVLEKLDDPEVDNFNEVGFIGGEFFNREISNEEVRKLFYKLFEKCAEKVQARKLDKIYITTALIYDREKYLIPFLNYLRELKILDKVLLCTSYDVEYRFHTEQRENLWKDNMLFLSESYPELKKHTETILTQSFINAVLEDKFSISDFCEKYKTRIDYIEPASGFFYHNKLDCAKDMPNFFPTKSSFIKFLKKVAIDKKEIDLKTFLSMEIRSEKLYYADLGVRYISDNRRCTDGSCTPHAKDIKYEFGFIDSNDKMALVAQQLFLTIGEK